MGERTFTLPYDFGDKVYIDGHKDMWATVIGFSFRDADPLVEVSWWEERRHCTAWFHPRRLMPVGE